MLRAMAASMCQEKVAQSRYLPFHRMARAATSIVAAEMTCSNGCFGFRWWEWRSTFFRRALWQGRSTTVAMAKKLAVHLYWKWR